MVTSFRSVPGQDSREHVDALEAFQSCGQDGRMPLGRWELL